jgi:DTW domain-containing protein YfiP
MYNYPARRKPTKVCLCDAIPNPKRPLKGHVVVLMHPQEMK